VSDKGVSGARSKNLRRATCLVNLLSGYRPQMHPLTGRKAGKPVRPLPDGPAQRALPCLRGTAARGKRFLGAPVWGASLLAALPHLLRVTPFA